MNTSDAGEAPVEQAVGGPVPERASACEHGCNGCDECTDYEDPADPSVHEPVGCKTPSGCSEHGCRGNCLEADPKCSRCGAPITTAMMPMICPHGRRCGFVEDDEHWQQVEALRVELGVERVKQPNTTLTGLSPREQR